MLKCFLYYSFHVLIIIAKIWWKDKNRKICRLKDSRQLQIQVNSNRVGIKCGTKSAYHWEDWGRSGSLIAAICNVYVPDAQRVSYTHTSTCTQLHKVLSPSTPLPLLPGSNQLSQHDVILLTLPHTVQLSSILPAVPSWSAIGQEWKSGRGREKNAIQSQQEKQTFCFTFPGHPLLRCLQTCK